MRCLKCSKIITEEQDGFCDKNCEYLFYNYLEFKKFFKSLMVNRTRFENDIIKYSHDSLWDSWKTIKDNKRISPIKRLKK